MGIRRAPLCIIYWLLAAINGLSISSGSGQQDVKYIPLQGSLELHIEGEPNKFVELFIPSEGIYRPVAKWDWRSAAKEKGNKYINIYINRTELNKETGVITIKNMTIEDSGGYLIVLDGTTDPSKTQQVVVQPGIATPRNEDEGNAPVIVGGIIGALILAVCLVLGVKYRDHIKHRLSSCGSKPVVDPESATPRDEDEDVPLRGQEESTPAENNLDSADVMDLIDAIVSKATEVKANKAQCQRLAKRVKGLEELVLTIKQKRASQNYAVLKNALCELKTTLEDAAKVVEKYASDSFHEHLWKDYKHRDDFKSLNDHLNDAFQKLSLNVQVDPNLQTKVLDLFNRDAQREEDEKDRKEDHGELQKIMELIDPIMSIATSLCSHCEEVMGNKSQCQCLGRRVKGLEDLVGEIKKKGAGQNSDDVEEALRDLKKTLESATEVVNKYTSVSFHKHVFNDYKDNTEFRSLNSSLFEAFKVLSKALQVDHNHKLYKLFNEVSRHAEDEADRMKDHTDQRKINDLIDAISKIKETTLSHLCKDARFNKDRRKCLVGHDEKLKNRVETIKKKGPGQNSAEVEKALHEVNATLTSAETTAFVEKYNPDSKFKHYGKEYEHLNDNLSNALNRLSCAHREEDHE